jgi:hypothetical protein
MAFDDQFENWLNDRLRVIKSLVATNTEQLHHHQQLSDSDERRPISSSNNNNNNNQVNYSSTADDSPGHRRRRDDRNMSRYHGDDDAATSPRSGIVRGMFDVGMSPAGNYYRFVYDEVESDTETETRTSKNIDDDDDEVRLSRTDARNHRGLVGTAGGSPTDADDEDRTTRLQRLSRLLGPDAVTSLGISELDDFDDQSGELLPPSTSVAAAITGSGRLVDENQNVSTSAARRSGGGRNGSSRLPAATGGKNSLTRAQNYSTTSLEFSDIDSYASAASDVATITGDEDDLDDEEAEPTAYDDHSPTSHPVVPPDDFFVSREPITFVEFSRTTATGVEGEMEMARRLVDDIETTTRIGVQPGSARGGGGKRAAAAGRRKKLDEIVSVRYRKADLHDPSADDDDNYYIDDDMLLQRQLPSKGPRGPGDDDVDLQTGRGGSAAGGGGGEARFSPTRGSGPQTSVDCGTSSPGLRGILPTDAIEMTLENSDDDDVDGSRDGDHVTTKDRAPIVSGADAQRHRRQSVSACCRTHRRLLLAVGIATAVVMVAAIGVVAYFLFSALNSG